MFVTRVNLSIMHVDITEVIGKFRVREKTVGLGANAFFHKLPVAVILIQTGCVGHVEILVVSGDALTAFDLNNFLQTIFFSDMGRSAHIRGGKCKGQSGGNALGDRRLFHTLLLSKGWVSPERET